MNAEQFDRIEDEMEIIKELLIATARMAERNNDAIRHGVEINCALSKTQET